MIRIDSTMQMRTRYRLRWWLVYWWLAGCVLVNTFALFHGPLSMTTIFIIVQVVPFLLGGILVFWVVLLFIGKADLGVWLTRQQYVLCLLVLWLFGLSPSLFVYGGSAWAAEQMLQTIESKYGVKVNVLSKGTGWYYDDGEWGPGLNTTWRVRASVKTDNSRQFVMQLASDLEKYRWEGRAVTETHYGFQCSNMSIPQLPFFRLPLDDTNIIDISLPKDSGAETANEVEIYFSFDAVNPFSSRCRL